MSETPAETGQNGEIGPKTKINWDQPPVSEQERDERMRRLYVAVEAMRDAMHGGIWSEQADVALHPEREASYEELRDISASGG